MSEMPSSYLPSAIAWAVTDSSVNRKQLNIYMKRSFEIRHCFLTKLCTSTGRLRRLNIIKITAEATHNRPVKKEVHAPLESGVLEAHL